ncbi:helix-turn-helix domain-containing protein [Streptomyces cavernae]|uniref:helix-turn-helix domain-containing protein n=1 Tax=Streptomyces cavernae TaxID=2259034 RepID=UPI001391E561|nr:AraC family transcriptional regulator [Streptomyces cavernae]
MTTVRHEPSALPPVQKGPGPWRGLSVAQETVRTEVTEWERPPSDGFLIVAHPRGAARFVADTGDGRWRSASCAPGDVCRIPPGRRVRVRCALLGPGPMELVHILLPTEVFGRHIDEEPGGRPIDLQLLETLPEPDPLIASMAVALVRARDAGAGQLYADSAAEYLAAHLLAPPYRGQAEPRALGQRQMDTVTAYMRAHLADRIGLDDLAREVALSRFHFLRLFSATTGQTPHQFLTGLRMETARRLLESGDEPVGRIGLLCGFSTASHFTTVFRRHVGHTPTDYRRLRRGHR